MKVTVLNGSARHGSTWHVKEELIKALGRYGEISAGVYAAARHAELLQRVLLMLL